MAAINDLINQIDNEELKKRITQEVEKLTDQKKFGLVFEEHLPECVPLYEMPIRRGSKVAQKTGKVNEYYTVMQTEGENVWCIKEDKKAGGKQELINFLKHDLVRIAEFGEPIYPYLQKIDEIYRAEEMFRSAQHDGALGHSETIPCHSETIPCHSERSEESHENGCFASLNMTDVPTHALIQADNYHALQLLEYLYAGKVDCIYIDPPYNTGARDWKYNNDYVDSSDTYRHSKWLSMMKKRLLLAKKLLNPADSVMIVTIDEKEYLHLGCLLEELFPEARIQMVSSVINSAGVTRGDEFSRSNEFLYFVKFGVSAPAALPLNAEWRGHTKSEKKEALVWNQLMRSGTGATRSDRPNMFYPLFINNDGTRIVKIGEPIPLDVDRNTVKPIEGTRVVWPIRSNGEEGRWRIGRETLSEIYEKGYVRLGSFTDTGMALTYLANGEQQKVETGVFNIIGHREDGSIIEGDMEVERTYIPGTQWDIISHNATYHGSQLLNKIIGKRFSFPKSLYAVHDAIRFFVANKPNALIVDFFAGSGTTLHAVNLLNAEDALATGKQGKRQCIMVTNNEVSEDEAKSLVQKGFTPGDAEWEKLGIAQYVTWPRTVCSIKGVDINGNPLKGNYLGSDIPMAEGFKANAVFFKLGFLDKTSVVLGRQFKELLPLLWLKAGGWGKCPETLKQVQGDSTTRHAELVSASLPPYIILPENRFAVLIDEKLFSEFEEKLRMQSEIETVYIITDFEQGFKAMSKALRVKKTCQLYRDYLDNFRINVERN